jgi:hypothetical protein
MEGLMIAKNFRRFPEALALQLCLPLAQVHARLVRARHITSASHNVAPPVGALRLPVRTRDRDVEDFPIGTVVRTPLGMLAKVEGYRGGKRLGGGQKDDHERLFCRYMDAASKKFGTVLLQPSKVEIVEIPEGRN